MRTIDQDQQHPGRPAAIATPADARAVSSSALEAFERWVTAWSTPPVLEAPRIRVAAGRPQDLSRLIEIVREAEMSCAMAQQEINRRARTEREGVGAEEWWERVLELIVRAREESWWAGRIRWLQDVRLYLEKEQGRWSREAG